MDSRHQEFLQDVLITMHVNIRDLKERRNFAAPEELTYIEGKLMAYMEMLAILRSSASEFNIDHDSIGL